MPDDSLVDLYVKQKKSLTDISNLSGVPISTVRNRILKLGVSLRTRNEAINLARHKLGVHLKGKPRNFSKEHLENLKLAGIRKRSKEEKVRMSSGGYLRISTHDNKDRGAHVVVMEKFLGRPIRDSEVVHHIDHNKTNNCIDNLCLMTVRGHTRLHRFEDELSGYKRSRSKTGKLN